jgi:hypothetical protein
MKVALSGRVESDFNWCYAQRKLIMVFVLCTVGRVLSFLGVLETLRKATVGFVMSVRLSACYNSAPNGRMSMKFDT